MEPCLVGIRTLMDTTLVVILLILAIGTSFTKSRIQNADPNLIISEALRLLAEQTQQSQPQVFQPDLMQSDVYVIDEDNFRPNEVDPDEDLPDLEVQDYGPDPDANEEFLIDFQNVRTARQGGKSRRKSKEPFFQPLCKTHRRTIHLTDVYYDFRPNSYDEVHCVHPYRGVEESRVLGNRKPPNVCNEGGYHCVQLNRTIFITKRVKGTSCWEMESRRVPSGCECMWPKHIKGDIQYYH